MNPDAQPAVRWIKYEYPPEESWAAESIPAQIDVPPLPRSEDVFARATLHPAPAPDESPPPHPHPCKSSIRDDVFLQCTRKTPPAYAAPLGRRALQQAYLPGISRSPPSLSDLSDELDIFNDGEIDPSSRRRRDSGFSSASDAPTTPDALLIPLPIKTEDAPEDDQLMAYMDSNCVELNVDVRTFCDGTGPGTGVRAGWAAPPGSSGPRHPCVPGAKVEPVAEPPATSHPRRPSQQRRSRPDGSSPRPDEPAPEACVASRSKRGRASTAQPAEPLSGGHDAPPLDRAGQDGLTAGALTKDEKMDVKRRKMAGNRLAAKKFRIKQKAKVVALQTKCTQLEATNAELVAELAAVRRALMVQTGGPVSNVPIHGR